MAKYLIIDTTKNDQFIAEYNTFSEALQEALTDYNHMITQDRASRISYEILESCNPSEEAENHLDGFLIIDFKDYANTICNGTYYTIDGKQVYLFGNDECWNNNKFFQYGLTEDGVFRFYYNVNENTDLDTIDYTQPQEITEA